MLLTGHTGFKGGWLAVWLDQLGARVHGYALDPPTSPSFFEAARVAAVLASDTRADLAEADRLEATFQATQPEIVFHLAAQPLVRLSYQQPIDTFATNVMGTAHVLDAARRTASVRAIVLITTDKVYENREWLHPYRECDPLGGHDPYSASKAAAELVAASYRASFFSGDGHPVRVATARAGNVIGGGDWANDRLVPDCLAAFARNEPVRLRFPGSVRPWQHVVEPLAGYLRLAERLFEPEGDRFARAWNFGPDPCDDATVGAVAAALARLWGDAATVEFAPCPRDPPEAGMLRLDNSLARARLGWTPRWSIERALELTTGWHRAWMAGSDMATVSLQQIAEYSEGGRL